MAEKQKMTIDTSDITGLVLAGGQGKRMHGQDKGLMLYQGRTLVEIAIEILKPQTCEIFISANRNLPGYAQYGYTIIEDEVAGFHGPLYGILSTLKRMNTEYLLTVPCDSPLLPACLAERFSMSLQQNNARASCAFDGERIHPVVNLLHRSLAKELQHYLDTGKRKMQTWLEQAHYVKTDFSDMRDCFINLNTQDELEQLAMNTRINEHV